MVTVKEETELIALKELAKIIRTKNAGPFEITMDIIFKSVEDYERVKATGVITEELIADLYSISVEDIIAFVYFDAANAVKATIPRPRAQGSIGETDMHAAQYHAPLLDIMIPR
ncbi:DUF4387 domain-containing protein [Bacillus taeanensis]|uniref:DUF4387 domain-containing protein n=2 Tax=Bacillus taeanensis TaxID=273032 RepID=A0A366XV61_9BACI|nr:DUF4387 domain-containing protein [Bacillus taeanensis]